jgi:hypothetical protein
LLPTIEKLDPQLMPESMWRCMSLLEPILLDNEHRFYTTEDKWNMAMFVGLYDVSLAKTLIGWLDATTPAESFNRNSLPARAVVDPIAAVAKVKAEKDLKQSSRDRVTIAKILGRQGEDRIRAIRNSAGLWNIDVEDIEP